MYSLSLQSTENKNTDFFRDTGHVRLKFPGSCDHDLKSRPKS